MNFTIRQVSVFIGVLWVLGFIASYFIPPMIVFHVTNPMAIALGVVLIWVYSQGFMDALRSEGGTVTPAHMLTFGVTLNWLGMLIRMGRWYFTGQHPGTSNNWDFWLYNTGLWISCWAGLFLLGASTLAIKKQKLSTLLLVFFTVFGILLYLGLGVKDIPNSNYWTY